MNLTVIASWCALNLGLAFLIYGIFRLWISSRPLTGPVLAKRLSAETGADRQRPDVTLGELAFLLRETGRPSPARLLTAVLTGWHTRGIIVCEMAAKKPLVSFGEDVQPTFAFTEGHAALSGAEEALAELLRSAFTEGNTLQSSESYNWARLHAAELLRALLRFEAEGRARLRAEGAVRQDTRKRLFGMAAGERLIYTPRGQRRALAMRRWENALREAPELSPADAALFGFGEPPQPLGRFCEKMIQGFAAGSAAQAAAPDGKVPDFEA